MDKNYANFFALCLSVKDMLFKNPYKPFLSSIHEIYMVGEETQYGSSVREFHFFQNNPPERYHRRKQIEKEEIQKERLWEKKSTNLKPQYQIPSFPKRFP